MNTLIFINKPLIKIIKSEVMNTYYKDKRPGRKLTHNLNDIIEGILFICKTGIQIKFCNYKGIVGSALKYHFDKWTNDNIFHKCWIRIYKLYQKNHKYKNNLKNLSIDCTFIKSINGVDCIGRNCTDRSRNATKLSTIVDLYGVPIGYFLDKANKNDHELVGKTIKNKIFKRKSKSNLYGDKGYACKKSKKVSHKNNMILYCENKANFKTLLFPKNVNITKYRYVIEASYSWLKSYRKIRLRYEKKIKYFESYLLLAFSMIISKKIHKK